ncbi:uncharacterized protein CBL_07346 [Carabus blaptoides fortunei]
MIEITGFYVSNAWIPLVFTVGCCIVFVSVLAVCVCGCRKETQKNDLLGLAGMVKITNPDENVNHLPAVGNYMSQGTGEPSITESDDPSKRPAGGSNPHRSLPDIPIYADGEVRIGSDNGVSGDTSSELYATVDDKTLSNIAYNKRHTLPNGVNTGPSLSHQSSISQSDSNYARLKENPYDKVKKSENPYANVQNSDNKENESSREPSPGVSWTEIAPRTTDSPDIVPTATDPVAPQRSRRSSGQSAINVTVSSTLPTSTPDIPAATAVAGRVAASQELPYMTPPITQPQHFSGDSQDSSRGYTSISVREPLANIISQTPAIRNRRTDLDPHYSTVSDDSDEMYAAIVEPNSNIYNGSETYAQIQPVTVAEVHGHPLNTEVQVDEDDQYEPAPQPPSVDSLKHVAHVHSRQASSSSCTSSIANLGSPKPEKRQANSPLPPPPSISPDLYARVDKNQDKEENHNNLTVAKNLEDIALQTTKAFVQSTAELSTVPFQNLNNQTDSNSKKSWSSRESFEDCKNTDSISVLSFESDLTSNSKGTVKRNQQEHCYETLNKNDKKNSPRKNEQNIAGYDNPPYDWQPDFNHVVSGPESILSNDPGYEQLNPHNRVPSEIDPNYEVLRPHRTSRSNASDTNSVLGYSTIGNCDKSTLTVNPNYTTVSERFGSASTSGLTEDGYSVVNKSKKSKSEPGYEEVKNQLGIIDEPNYESMPSECADDNYATINQKSTESESEPNYESVKYLDVTLSEPPYERLNDDETKESSDLSEYEQISGKQDPADIPGYERIKETGSKSSENSEDRSDSSKLSNGNEETACIEMTAGSEINQTEIPGIVLTVMHETAEVRVNITNEKDIVETDIFHV